MICFRHCLVAFVLLLVATPVEAQPWQAWVSPEEAGFDAARLHQVQLYADSVQSGAVMVVYQGHVLAAWGDIQRPYRVHSVRKSLVSALYGILIEAGVIELDATLADLGIDDLTQLTETERQARVRDLIAARSGVFLPAAYAPEDQDEDRPPRGSHAPGTQWFYNNWDFNVAGVIVERATGEGLYDVFDRHLARPIGMEDYDVDDGFLVYEPGLSRHPAHTFRLSARDLARFGQLYLQNGRWNGTQVIPARWVAESTQAVTDFGGGRGYGYMWWTYREGSLGEAYPHLNRHALYQARGTGGQALYVIPDAELVIVHRGDTDHDRDVPGRDVWRMAEMILAARTGEPEPNPALKPVEVVSLASQLPAPEPRIFGALSPEVWADYLGAYEIAPGVEARIFEWEGRVFGFFPGRGEAELFALDDDHLTVRVVSGVEIRFTRDDTGAVVAMDVWLGPEHFRGVKQP